MKLLTELYKIPAKTGNEEQIKSFILENVKDIPMQVVTDCTHSTVLPLDR